MKRYDFQNKTVLVTGSSMGIGEIFARELTRRGARVILVARSEDKLKKLASELGTARYVAADLTAPGAASKVFDEVKAMGLEVDVLVNNAGFGAHGPFLESSLEGYRGQVALNVGALVELTYLFLPGIEARGGGVIQVASTAAFQPVPYMAVYGATKAFVLSFSEALWAEYRGRGVRILALCPGATDTPFFERSGESAALGAKASPEDVVRVGLDAFGSGRASVIHGAANYMTALINRLVSREMTAKIAARMMRPREVPRLSAS